MTQPQLRPGGRCTARARDLGPRDHAEGRQRTVDLPAQAETSLLPTTARLLTHLRTSDADDLRLKHVEASSEPVARYCARPHNDGPFLRFLVEDASSILLGLAQCGEPGFDVLQIRQGQFKYHWRNDLIRAFEEEVPILGRYWAFSGDRAMAVEHLVVPVIVRHRVRALRGWFTFGQDPTAGLRAGSTLSIVRRPLRSRIVQVPDWPSHAVAPDPNATKGRGRWRRAGHPKRFSR